MRKYFCYATHNVSDYIDCEHYIQNMEAITTTVNTNKNPVELYTFPPPPPNALQQYKYGAC